jgi:chorismate synthase
MLVRNKDARPQAYDEMKEKFRPSHADFTYQNKFGIRNHEGGGRSSARKLLPELQQGRLPKKS